MSSDSQLPGDGNDNENTLITPHAAAEAPHRKRTIVLVGTALALGLTAFGVSAAMASGSSPGGTAGTSYYRDGGGTPSQSDRSGERPAILEEGTKDGKKCDSDGKRPQGESGEKPAGRPNPDGAGKPPAPKDAQEQE
jgi:hypothetical protein